MASWSRFNLCKPTRTTWLLEKYSTSVNQPEQHGFRKHKQLMENKPKKPDGFLKQIKLI